MAFSNNPLVYLTKKSWHYAKGNRQSVVIYVILFLFANLCQLSQTFIVAFALNTIQAKGVHTDNFFTIAWYLAALVASDLAFWVFHGPARVMETTNAFFVRSQYKKYLLDGVMHLPIEWHTDHHSGDTIDKVEKGSQALYNFTTDTFMIIQAIVTLAVSYVVLIFFNFSASYIVAIALVFAFWAITRFDKILVPQYEKLFHTENTISEKVYDAISNITTVIILRVEKLVTSSIYKKLIEPRRLFVKNSRVNELKWFTATMSQSVMVFLVLVTYLYHTISVGGVIAIGTVYLLYGYVSNIGRLFFSLASMYGDIVQRKTAVMNAEELAKEFATKKQAHEIELGTSWNELDIKSLSFSYNPKRGSVQHLDNVSLKIGRGKRIALIGESGSGKTTMLKIIRGLYEPREYTLLLDTKPVAGGFNAISESIALIPQDPELFATTIKENLTLGVDRTLEEIKKYTDLACFTEVAEQLPKKFDSSIVEKGVNLSGGEKQRLALARGLMACEEKAIILLDEPTSSVDYKNELAIYNNIFGHFKDATIISTVHRLNLLSLFDFIYIFSNGEIIASGSFADLLQNSEEFKKIWIKYNKTTKRS